MRTLLPDPPPAEFQQLLDQRRQWGADVHDEVWEGVLHMAPAPHGRHANVQLQVLRQLAAAADQTQLIALAEFDLGQPDDCRVPDGGLQRPGPDLLYYPTAALVLEVISPGDQTPEKIGFYAAHQVDELLIVDPEAHTITWLARHDDQYRPLAHSHLIELAARELVINWPA